MGANASRIEGSAEEPLPISPDLNRNLNKLSMIAARVLNTPDLYDVDNLARPGVCGDYAVFLKKYLEKEVKTALNPFVAEVDLGKGKERTEIVFMNPRKLISEEARKEICKSISTAMVRTIAIIVASLASIQVAVTARKTAVAGIQKGGDYSRVLPYLSGRYIDPKDVTKGVGQPMEMVVRPDIRNKGIKFYLTLNASTTSLTTGSITALGGDKHPDGPMPAGALRVQFLDPIRLPVPGDKEALPVRILDAGSMPWLAGILFESVFISFYHNPAKTPRDEQRDFSEILEILFRKTQGWEGLSLHETRAETQIANRYFALLEKSGPAAYDSVFKVLADFIRSVGGGGAPQAPGYPPMPGYGYGYGAASFAPIVPVAQPVAAVPLGGLARGYAGAQPLQYTIPQSATKNLLATLKSFGTKLAIENSPAAMRAQTLAGNVLPSRNVTTMPCKDPYWTLENLSTVYPWATLQFLCVKDWGELKDERITKDVFVEDWDAFLRDLGSIYSGNNAPRLERRGDSKVLNDMRIKDIANLKICATDGALTVRRKEVNDGLMVIQGIYERHVAAIWGLLNKLIYTIVDPDTKVEHVRLHPDVLKAETAERYVEERAAEARKLIAKFYIDVEKAYLEAVRNLVQV